MEQWAPTDGGLRSQWLLSMYIVSESGFQRESGFQKRVDASDYEPQKIFKFHPCSFPTSKTILSQLEKSEQIRKYKFYIIKHYYEKTFKTNLIEIMQKAVNKPQHFAIVKIRA